MKRYRRAFGVAFLVVCYGLVGLVLGDPDRPISLAVLLAGVVACTVIYVRAHPHRDS